MSKLPTLFFRSGLDLSVVTSTVNPECTWVAAGEGIATVGFDGVVCTIEGGVLYRIEDAEDLGDGPYEEAWQRRLGPDGKTNLPDGIYALVGLKVHGNPYGLEEHQLWPQGVTFQEYSSDFDIEPPRDYDGLRIWFETWETVWGILWSHPDGRMAQITRQDFGLTWPPRSHAEGQ